MLPCAFIVSPVFGGLEKFFACGVVRFYNGLEAGSICINVKKKKLIYVLHLNGGDRGKKFFFF